MRKFIPESSIQGIVYWLQKYNVQLTVTRPRKTKLGDYRSPWKDAGHRISINGDLNPYAFLVTLIHEFAHLFTHEEYKERVKPHGPEWKSNYKIAMDYFLDKGVFPKDIEMAIRSYMIDPAASSCVDQNLYSILRKYDDEEQEPDGMIQIGDLNEGEMFAFPDDKKVFEKGPLMRKRYRCKELLSGRMYAVSGIAKVFPLKPEIN